MFFVLNNPILLKSRTVGRMMKMKVSYGPGEITIGELMQSNPLVMLWVILGLTIFLSIVFTVIILLCYRARKRERQLVKQISRLNEQLQAVVQQAGTLCWKYDISKKRVEMLKNDVIPQRCMPNEYLDNVPEYFLEHQMIHPDSHREFLKLYGRISVGVKKAECVVQLRNSVDSPWRWEKITYINRFDDRGRAMEAIGFATDVTLEMEQEIAIRSKAEIDSLTGLYDRHAFEQMTEELIQDRRETRPNMALCVWNLDQFQRINQKYGNEKGDDILKEVARVLKEGCRKTDIIGRMSGDEFLVFFLDVKEIEKLERKVNLLLQRIQLIVLSEGEKISASAGMTMSEKNSDTFQELYRRAQDAMKEAKSAGGNQYIVK